MKEPETSSQKEEKAVQALISAALHVRDGDVSMEEIQPYLSNDIVLSQEDEEALKRKAQPLALASLSALSPQETAEVEAFMALHRKKPEQGFSAKTEEEVKKKRDELLDKLRKKKGAG
jgi:hypothetical protein